MKNALCVYCGFNFETSEMTRDHIPPRSFFTAGERDQFQLITVPSCKQCNNGCSAQDENAKHLLSLAVSQMQNDTPDQTLLHKKTIDKNRRLQDTLSNSTLVWASDENIYTPRRLIRIDSKYLSDTRQVFERIARGIYWHHFHEVLDASAYSVSFPLGLNILEIHKPQGRKNHKIKTLLDIVNLCNRVDLLRDICTYWYMRVPENHQIGIFHMLYRRSILVSVMFE